MAFPSFFFPKERTFQGLELSVELPGITALASGLRKAWILAALFSVCRAGSSNKTVVCKLGVSVIMASIASSAPVPVRRASRQRRAAADWASGAGTSIFSPPSDASAAANCIFTRNKAELLQGACRRKARSKF